MKQLKNEMFLENKSYSLSRIRKKKTPTIFRKRNQITFNFNKQISKYSKWVRFENVLHTYAWSLYAPINLHKRLHITIYLFVQ